MDENTTPEPSLEESIQFLLGQVPVPVRNFVLHDLGPKTEDLMTRYDLHIDQGGILERELLLMLLGQETPAEFVAALQETGLPPEKVQALTNDINMEVFVKLRESEEKARGTIQAPIPTNAPVPSAPPPAPVAPSVFHSAAAQEPVVAPRPPAPAPFPVSSAPEEHDVRTMASDMAMMKSGGLHQQHVAPPTPAEAQVFRPAATPMPAPTPIYSPSTPAVPKSPAPQTENREALHEILKSYGVDPYREPAD